MTKKKQTKYPKHPDYAPTTPQNMVDMFKFHAETLTRKWNEFSHKPNDPELAICHGTYEQTVSTCRDLTKKYLGIDLPELPELPGNDYLAGINHLARYCKDSAITLTEKPDSKPKDIEIDPETKEQQWRETASDYMENSEAIVTFTNNKMSLSVLSKLLTPDGSIRYMRKGQRCKVHIGDFRDYASKHYVPDKLANEIADERLADREAKKEELKRNKNRTGK